MKKTINQKINEITRKLESAKNKCDLHQLQDLELIITNDTNFWHACESLYNYKNHKQEQDLFDETLFIQLAYYVINNILNTQQMQVYGYNKSNVNTSTRWLLAQELAFSIE